MKEQRINALLYTDFGFENHQSPKGKENTLVFTTTYETDGSKEKVQDALNYLVRVLKDKDYTPTDEDKEEYPYAYYTTNEDGSPHNGFIYMYPDNLIQAGDMAAFETWFKNVLSEWVEEMTPELIKIKEDKEKYFLKINYEI